MNNRRAFLKIASLGIGSNVPVLLIHSARQTLLEVGLHEAQLAETTDVIFAPSRMFDIESVAMARMHHHGKMRNLIRLNELFSALHTFDAHAFELPMHAEPVAIVIDPYEFNVSTLIQNIITSAEERSNETYISLEPLLQSERAWYIPRSIPLRTRTRSILTNRSRYARSRL